jgi:hypothetical protein
MGSKKVIGTWVMAPMVRVLRVDECMIFERASFSSPLKVFKLQVYGISGQRSQFTIIEKQSRQQNGSRRMASSDVPFIHTGMVNRMSMFSVRVIVLTKY